MSASKRPKGEYDDSKWRNQRRSTKEALQQILHTEIEQDQEDFARLREEIRNLNLASNQHAQHRATELEGGLKGFVSGKENDQILLAHAQAEAKDLRNQLQECQAEIFKLQPKEQFTDEDISSKYDELTQLISAWVNQVLDMAQEKGDGKPIAPNISGELAELCARHSNTWEFFLMKVVFEVIQEQVFTDGHQIPGMTKELSDLVFHVEHSEIHAQHGSTDFRNTWLAALVNYAQTEPKIAAAQSNHIDVATRMISEKVVSLNKLYSLGVDETQTSLRDIVSKAFIFTNAYKSCRAKYQFQPRVAEWELDLKGPFLDVNLKSCELRDIRRGKRITQLSSSPFKEKGGKIVTLIAPALFNEDRGHLCIGKGVLLIELHESSTRNQKKDKNAETRLADADTNDKEAKADMEVKNQIKREEDAMDTSAS